MVSILRAVQGDLRSWAGCRELETPGRAAYSSLSVHVTSVWQCLQIRAIRGRGPGGFQPGLEAGYGSGNWTSRPRWWGDCGDDSVPVPLSVTRMNGGWGWGDSQGWTDVLVDLM